MQPDTPLTRDLVLIGGGHAHALVMRAWGMDPLPGARLTVINPGPTAPYTGMLPGHVAGHYTRAELDIDLARLARFAGARLIDGAVDAIDADARRLHIAGWGDLDYDVASIDVGITAEMPEIPGFAEHGTGAKPLGAFAHRWRRFLAEVEEGTKPPNVAVIGGGVAGVELSLAMAHALRAPGRAPAVVMPAVVVIETADQMTGMGDRARKILRAAMTDLGVTLRTGAGVAQIAKDHVVLADGDTIDAAFVTGAAGARPHGWIADTGLPLERGFIRVGRTLAVEGRDDLFAAGDCAHMTHAPRPKAGVFAVRQAPILHANLRAALSGGRGRIYQPQARYLKLISLGGESALAERGGVAVSGPWLWRWKDHIDRSFMDRLTDLPAMAVAPPPKQIAQGGDAAKPLCAGCGSKIAGDALAAALRVLPEPSRDDVLSRPGDDAAVLDHGDTRQVITTDHLRAFTHDPALMTRIAAVHALGDVWSMGAQPQAALAQITLPRMSETLQTRTLTEVLAAAAEVFGAAGADLVGGHSTMGAETVIGFTVTGLTDAPIGHDGARPGDAIILTRPIGTGVILAAEMAGAARGRDVVDMLTRMATPQGDAAAILSGAGAMTDVTGFGLAGHLMAVCRASGLVAEIALDAVPTYAGAIELSEAGHISSLHAANLRGAPVTGGQGARLALLHDPQTAGGLLAAVPNERADEVVGQLRAAGHDAARIGTFADGMPAITCV
ncbi:Selenide, water dikinase [Jannaschia donghaensis]|uniref:Selenide, water dikinase n=2 Tax=Jannaschia donghaensis TaxID=420998 RepID=A0A0M6YNT7_9RHOB|nr:Selenide, water dikinase [Jannaschia donghaensis]